MAFVLAFALVANQIGTTSAQEVGTWGTAETTAFPIPVTVDASRVICRSADAAHWIGIVAAGECVGKTYDDAWSKATQYERLFQAR